MRSTPATSWLRRLLLVGAALALVAAPSAASASRVVTTAPADNAVAEVTSAPWSFGIIGDTQWNAPSDPAGTNPQGVPLSIIEQVDQQFIAAGVKFVVQVGDLAQRGTDAAEAVHAAAMQDLYDHGIGYFPMRGNHETNADPATDFATTAFRTGYPQTQGLANTFGAEQFSSPTLAGDPPDDLAGLSYSFDYGPDGGDARFVIIDPWATANQPGNEAGDNYGYTVGDQQDWISDRLDASKRGTEHAFVLSHQALIGQYHYDTVFSGYANVDPDMQNAFFASLEDNGVGYYLNGHDHIFQRSLIASPDGASRVQQVEVGGDSTKFYTPRSVTAGNWFGQKVAREKSVQQDLYRIGYYIFTVDGPRVTVDYYADNHGSWGSDECWPDGTPFLNCTTTLGSQVTPEFTFEKRASWGYSTNGEEFPVGGSGGNPSYTVVQDSFEGTDAAILWGTYPNNLRDYRNRVLTQPVDTGWTVAGDMGAGKRFASDILTLWGMAPLGAQTGNAIHAGETAPYVLSLSYDKGATKWVGSGSFGIGVRTGADTWVNAVNLNYGGTKTFVEGPWDASYGLGTYGVDTDTKTVWAVLDYNGDFAAYNGIQPLPDDGD